MIGILLIIAFIGYAIFILHVWSRTQMFNSDILWNTFSFGLFIYYIQFYVIGCICAMYKEKFEKAISKAGWLTCILFLICHFTKAPLITSYSGIAAFFFICKSLGETRRPTLCKFNHRLSRIGQITLEIYLLHYFFLFGLKEIDIVHKLYDLKDTLYEFPSFLTVTLLITGGCVALLKIMQSARIKTFLFPTFANNKPTL